MLTKTCKITKHDDDDDGGGDGDGDGDGLPYPQMFSFGILRGCLLYGALILTHPANPSWDPSVEEMVFLKDVRLIYQIPNRCLIRFGVDIIDRRGKMLLSDAKTLWLWCCWNDCYVMEKVPSHASVDAGAKVAWIMIMIMIGITSMHMPYIVVSQVCFPSNQLLDESGWCTRVLATVNQWYGCVCRGWLFPLRVVCNDEVERVIDQLKCEDLARVTRTENRLVWWHWHTYVQLERARETRLNSSPFIPR